MASDTIHALCPLHVLAKAVGIAPFSVSRAGGRQNMNVAKGDACLFVFHLCGLVALLIFSFKEHFNTVGPGNFLEYYVGTVRLVISSVIAAGAIVCGLSQRKDTLDIYVAVDKISRQLPAAAALVTSSKTRSFCWIIIGPRFACLLLFSLYDMFVSSLFKMLHHYFTSCIDMMVMSEIIIILFVLRQQLAQANGEIEQLVNKDASPRQQHNLKRLCKVHDDVCDACEQLNRLFHFYLVMKHLMIFSSLVYAAFFITYIIKMSDFQAEMLVDVIFWTADNVKEILLLVVSCELMLAEIRRTIEVLIARRTREGLAANEVSMNILRVTQRQLEITAFHFFPVDFTVLYSIIAGVTTYFVYLLQFSNI